MALLSIHNSKDFYISLNVAYTVQKLTIAEQVGCYWTNRLRRVIFSLLIALLVLVAATSGCTSAITPDSGYITTIVAEQTFLPQATPTPVATLTRPVHLAVNPSPTTPPPTSTPELATATPLASPEPVPQGSLVLLLYQNGQFARTDIDGSIVVPLASVSGVGEEPSAYFYANPPQISPDGRWLIDHVMASETTGNWRLFDVATGEMVAVGSGQSKLSPTWAPNSEGFAFLRDGAVCIYTLRSASEACTPVVDVNGTPIESLIGASWSPNGDRIALAQSDMSVECCHVTVWLFALDGSESLNVGVIEPPAQANTEDIIEWLIEGRLLFKSTSAGVPSILYNPTDESSIFYDGWLIDVSPNNQWMIFGSGMVGGPDGAPLYALPGNDVCTRPILSGKNWAWSPDGTRLAFLLNCAAAKETSWVYILDAATGEVQLEKVLPTPAEALYPLDRVFWSPVGEYLLLDGPDTTVEFTRPLSPIWRLAAERSGELEVLVESGYLLDVVPQWVER